MTREEHIENLKAIASDMPSDKCADWIESLMAGVKALEQVSSSEKPNKWIPCSERLPNFAGVYLVTRYFPNNVMNPTYLVDACFFDGTDTWHNDNRINHDRKYLTNVVAWLEEPEPYKEIPTGAEGRDGE